MKSAINKFIGSCTANIRAQRMLQQTIDWLNFFTGVGCGGNPYSSGESSLTRLLAGDPDSPKSASCIFDVGANYGGFINMVMSNHGDNNFFIHAFEPGQAAFQILVENTEHIECLKLNNFGLGAAPGEKTLYYSAPGSGLASLTKRRLDHFRKQAIEHENPGSESVKIETLDNYCKSHNIDMIDLLKIDVEGHELDVLLGASEMLSAGKIRYLTFEFGGCNIDTRIFFQDYWYFFKRFPTAEIFRITPSGYLLPIRKYLETHEQFRCSNFLVRF